MARRLHMIGTTSDVNKCPALYEDLDTGEVLVQAEEVTDPEDLAQLGDLKDSEKIVAAPRRLFTQFAPRQEGRESVTATDGEFDQLFDDYKHTAWRLETRRRYLEDEVTEKYGRFLHNGDASWDPNHPWLVARREAAAAGKRMERVRIVDDPITDGQRYLLESARWNNTAGEDIRNMWRADARRVQLPDEDFWLFDSRLLALLHFGDNDDFLYAELTTDPIEVARACQVRDAAWHYAVPNREFVAGLPSAM